MNPKALREQRAKLVADFRAIYDRAESEKRTLNSDELVQARGINDEIARLKEQIDLAEALEVEERGLVPETQRETRAARTEEATPETTAVRRALDAYLRHGAEGVSAEHRGVLAQYQARSQNTISGPSGGYLVRPDMSLYTSIVEAMKFFGGVRQMGATVLSTTTGADLPMPTTNDTANEGAIVNEEGSHLGGTDVAIGQRVLKAYLYSSKVVKVSLQLLQDIDFPIEGFLGRLFGQRIARVHNRHCTVGTGVNQPQGYLVAAPVGKTTSGATAITFDEVLDLVHSVDRAYRAQGAFSMHDSTALALKKLKDLNGQYIWQASVQVGAPDRLLGYPIVYNNDIPTIATGQRTIAFGDHSAYYLRDVSAFQVVRLNELYAENGQVGFLAFSRHDGGLIDAGTGPIKVLQQA
jgi:HK97 family phage major capsid protein